MIILVLGGVASWGGNSQAGPSEPGLGLEGPCIYERRQLGLDGSCCSGGPRAQQRLSGVVKLVGKVGHRDDGVAVQPLVVDLVTWQSPRPRVGLGRWELSCGLPHELHGQRRRGSQGSDPRCWCSMQIFFL
jgi:hypothetical protein